MQIRAEQPDDQAAVYEIVRVAFVQNAALSRAGLDACRAAGHDAAIVLGHPEYDPRFGFAPASRFGITSEYKVRDGVFVAMELKEGALADCRGLARYQPEFNEI